MGFIYPAMDQIANHLARLRKQNSQPADLSRRHTHAARWRHSRARASLRSASRRCWRTMQVCVWFVRHRLPARTDCCSRPFGTRTPVIFLEPVRLYRLTRQEVADDGQAHATRRVLTSCARARIVTIVTWGAMTVETLKVAQEWNVTMSVARSLTSQHSHRSTTTPSWSR